MKSLFSRFLLLLLLGSSVCLEPVFASQVDSIIIASVQFPIEGRHSIKSFLKKVETYVQAATKQKADLVLFPEWIVLDLWPIGQNKSDQEVVQFIASEVTDPYCSKLKDLAKKYKIIIAGGSTAFAEKGKIYNTAAMVFPNGRFVKQSKNYRTKWETSSGIAADNRIEVVDTKFGRIVTLICYDVEFPDISTKLAGREVDLFLVPSMTESQSGEARVLWTAQSRAVEHTSYIVISPAFGRVMKDWQIYGVVRFLTPRLPGFPGLLAEGKRQQAGVTVEKLSLKALREAKKTSSWRPAAQIRVEP